MIRLDAATVLLQWAVGGLAFLWVTTRRREVSLGYGWLLRGSYGLMAIGALYVGLRYGDPVRGRDVASAGVVLASSDPRGVDSVITLSRATYRKMLQNLGWAAGYNILAIPLAAGAFAWAGLTLSPAVGAVLMSLSTIVVALNAQLLRRVQLNVDS